VDPIRAGGDGFLGGRDAELEGFHGVHLCATGRESNRLADIELAAKLIDLRLLVPDQLGRGNEALHRDPHAGPCRPMQRL